jgi:tetratricopeptide (TPR) repeat protein
VGASSRWLVAVLAALACFGGCWAGLAMARVLDTGSQVGVASVPLVVVLTVLGAWAERAREKKRETAGPGDQVSAKARDSPRSQVTGQVSGGIVIGPGSVVSLGGADDHGQPLRHKQEGPGQVLVVGDVPQEPVAFQPRAGLAEALDRGTGPRVSVVSAVTGIRGVGKTQVAAACARRRIAEGWRLVAWVDASSETSMLADLAQVAIAAGMGTATADPRELAAGVRHWLEADGYRRLLVFDNVADLDVLRPFVPAGGAAQVVVTSSRRSAGSLGVPVLVDVFSEDEALAFLAERTGLHDVADARELAGELGYLPLGMAQAAALIAQEHLSYRTYLGRLRALPVADYLQRAEGDAYPHRLAEVITLSLRGVEGHDPSGACIHLMNLVSVLAETGVPRRLLHLAASKGMLGDGRIGAAVMDASLGTLADASLLGFTIDNESVVAHRLVMRVTRERLAAEGTLPGVLDNAIKSLSAAAAEIAEAWHDPAGVRDLARHVTAVMACLTSHPDATAKAIAAGLLQLRLRSVYLLNMVGDSTGLAILAAEPLAADCGQVLGADHPDTLTAQTNLAHAYRAVGRTAEAIPLLERTLTDRERILGPDHPSTLSSRNNLATAYQDAGRTAEAIPLLERTLTDRERILGPDHPSTLSSRNNLATAYQDAGRTAEAIPLLERTLTDRERILGPDHPATKEVRENLARLVGKPRSSHG